MKKDFSQPFIKEPSNVWIFVRDEISGHYLVLTSGDEWEKDFYNILEIDNKSQDTTLVLAKYLYELGLDLASFRELLCQTHLEYNVVDDTPGAESDELCLLAFVNKTARTATKVGDQKVEWVSEADLFNRLTESPLITEFIKVSLARLAVDLG